MEDVNGKLGVKYLTVLLPRMQEKLFPKSYNGFQVVLMIIPCRIRPN